MKKVSVFWGVLGLFALSSAGQTVVAEDLWYVSPRGCVKAEGSAPRPGAVVLESLEDCNMWIIAQAFHHHPNYEFFRDKGRDMLYPRGMFGTPRREH